VKVRDLVTALLRFDALTARQWVADAERADFDWAGVEPPTTKDPTEAALYAAIVELLASRAGHSPPGWTEEFASAPEPVYLVKAARTMRRLRALCEQEGPEPLRRRRFLAPPDFLSVA
jgi:hypothetical protein